MKQPTKEQMLFYLFANYIDKYSIQNLGKEGEQPIQDEICKKARKVHYAMQEFLHLYDMASDVEYYDFFFENSVKEQVEYDKLIDKYIDFKE